MISKKLKTILYITLILIFLHGLEEVISTFPVNDSWMIFFGNFFQTKTEVFYWTFHIMWWILVLVGVGLLSGNRKIVLGILTVFGVLYFTELHHVIKALITRQFQYYPGMLTGLAYPILGIFYWKELIVNWRKYDK